MFIKLSYSYNVRKFFCKLASTCKLAASGFCNNSKSALIDFENAGQDEVRHGKEEEQLSVGFQ